MARPTNNKGVKEIIPDTPKLKPVDVVTTEAVEMPFPVRLKRNYFTNDGKHTKDTTIIIPISEARLLVQNGVAEVDFEEVVKRFYG
ncbi:hypothetical protein [Phyllobacterium sophorae]|uniref:Uncharacterized protein n=1 Tax=Phyllobacterium sophorae TaxID=1520277 RepID=A0A2P7BDX6_9HYPH|nr:hypothetical protein [Phyllobacterium sophorae]PSH64661.1 hypothetical protein CU103_12320 [Phyllobacterium sophorae]